MRSRGEDVTQLTMEGMTTGTPGYIAPEVALGEPTIDGRADLYALGCVAYFLLTGTLVFPDSESDEHGAQARAGRRRIRRRSAPSCRFRATSSRS